MMDDIPSFASMDADTPSAPASESDFDDSILENVDDYELEQEVDGEIPPVKTATEFNELEDLPGLDDWLTQDNSEDHKLLDELDQADFDELLGGIGADADSEPAAEDDIAIEKPDMSLGNPDLDLAALLNDPDSVADTAEPETEAVDSSPQTSSIEETPIAEGDIETLGGNDEEDFLDVDSLINDGFDEDTIDDNAPLDLDVSLSDFTGVSDDDDVIDIDKDAGQSANLDLARVYVEMDDVQAAKELLQEVVEKGSDEQKEEAQGILSALG